jgi:hypothetical protein
LRRVDFALFVYNKFFASIGDEVMSDRDHKSEDWRGVVGEDGGSIPEGAELYMDTRIKNGDRPQYYYPQNGIPKTKIFSEDIETSFFWGKDKE